MEGTSFVAAAGRTTAGVADWAEACMTGIVGREVGAEKARRRTCRVRHRDRTEARRAGMIGAKQAGEEGRCTEREGADTTVRVVVQMEAESSADEGPVSSTDEMELGAAAGWIHCACSARRMQTPVRSMASVEAEERVACLRILMLVRASESRACAPSRLGKLALRARRYALK